jgi:hypothetical protein
LRSNSVDRSFIVSSRTDAARHRVAADRTHLRSSPTHERYASLGRPFLPLASFGGAKEGNQPRVCHPQIGKIQPGGCRLKKFKYAIIDLNNYSSGKSP